MTPGAHKSFSGLTANFLIVDLFSVGELTSGESTFPPSACTCCNLRFFFSFNNIIKGSVHNINAVIKWVI